VWYADIHDPRALAMVTVAEDPAAFATTQRELLASAPFAGLRLVPELAMMGRTYGSGRERDLADWLLRQVPLRLAAPANEWAVWYPLRRKPGFYQLEARNQGRILAEHGMLGHAYGEAGLAQDIRLKCFGLDRQDNEFLIGLVGPQLAPLSRLVEDMRQTKQTAEWLDNLGPFIVGKRVAMANL
jgi:chlorite dismutase